MPAQYMPTRLYRFTAYQVESASPSTLQESMHDTPTGSMSYFAASSMFFTLKPTCIITHLPARGPPFLKSDCIDAL